MTYKIKEILNIKGWGKDFQERLDSTAIMIRSSEFLQKVADSCIEKDAIVLVQSIIQEGRMPESSLKENLDIIEHNTGIRGITRKIDSVDYIEFKKVHDGINSYMKSAKEFLEKRNLDKVIEPALKVILFSSEMKDTRYIAEAWQIIGDTFTFQKPPKFAEALEAYKKSNAAKPEMVKTLRRLLFTYYMLKNFEEADILLQGLPERLVKDPNILKEKAAILADRGDLGEAERIARQLKDAHPEEAIFWELLAHILGLKGDWQQARNASREALNHDDKRISGWLNLTEAYLGLEKYTSAEKAVESALELDNESGTAWYLKHRILKATERIKEANQALKQAEKYGHPY